MVRRIRDTRLETRTGRLGLKVRKKPVYVSIGRSLSIGYRRNKTEGTWIFRRADGKGGMQTKAIGKADDYAEADGVDVLDFWQAQEKVKYFGRRFGQKAPAPMTTGQAFDGDLHRLARR